MPKLVRVSKHLESELMKKGNKSMREKFPHEQKKKLRPKETRLPRPSSQGILHVNRSKETCTSMSVSGMCVCFFSLFNPVQLF